VIAGANMVLVDFHPDPGTALVDGPQALKMDELALFVEDIRITREAYQRRCELQMKREQAQRASQNPSRN
jgi:3-deoxy-7-phosphoheptulonate synthase